MKRLMYDAVSAMACGVGSAQADVSIGLWQSPPDARGIVLQVRTRPCGQAICGQVERVNNRQGYDAPSRDVGRPVLVNLVPEVDGGFAGQVWEPLVNRMMSVRMQVEGNLMRFQNFHESDCRNEVWRRVR
ncbi:hypothetical protein [Sulfitobacter sp.]|uniref:hypothetical protein n=1 Tax=Sulfitobacter sp. TaxID=1903071 RepID=UPI0030029E42